MPNRLIPQSLLITLTINFLATTTWPNEFKPIIKNKLKWFINKDKRQRFI